MRPILWAVLAAVGVVVFGVIFGIAGIFIAPILGFLVLLGIALWIADRRSEGKPPLE